MTGAGILGIVVSKFRYIKKLCLIILFEVDKNLKIGLHYAILLLNLTICLWVEGGREFLLDA